MTTGDIVRLLFYPCGYPVGAPTTCLIVHEYPDGTFDLYAHEGIRDYNLLNINPKWVAEFEPTPEFRVALVASHRNAIRELTRYT